MSLLNKLRETIKESIKSSRKIYVLVGPPGIGKSTWVKNNVENPYIISRDDLVDFIRKPLNIKYDDMFSKKADDLNKEINKLLKKRFAEAADSNQDVVVDMTNMNSQSRKNALNSIQNSENFEKIAVFFDHRGKEKLVHKSVKMRGQQLNDKNLGPHIINGMLNRFEIPTTAEGFDSVIIVDPSDALNRHF